MLCIYHIADHDGKGSAAIVKSKFPETELMGLNHDMDIPYDEIIYGKPWPGHKGFYVDDRTIRPDEFLNSTIDELNDICDKSKDQSR